MSPILLLSPVQSLSKTAHEVAAELGIRIHVGTSDDRSVEQVVRQYPDIEVVISRGGLAEIAARIEGISVVKIAMSIEDLLINISTLTARGLRRIGIVNRANLFSGVTGDFRILDALISIHAESDDQHVKAKIGKLVDFGFEAIIGGRTACTTARELGIGAVFLESGRTSIRTALEEAIRIIRAKEREKLQTAQLTAIIDNIDEAVIALTPEHEVNFFNRHAKRLCTNNLSDLPDFQHALSILDTGEKEQITSINGNNVIAHSIPLEFDNSARGKIITLQEVANIQASETKIRTSFHQKGLYARYYFADIVGESDAIRQLIARARVYAGHDSNLVVYGETGTGKEILVQSIHNHSQRNKGPFVSVNVASIPANLLESELFGYVDGAFTGARKGGKHGLFELAHEGTLFLDEIGELAPEMQSRLLRVLQEREIMRIGDDKIIPINVRVISATNRNLFQQTQNGSFRQDLYYRIHVAGLRIPPLRARPEDIPLIFEYYLRRFVGKAKRTIYLTPSARDALLSYSWPGNVRQLRNIAEVVAYSHDEQIDVKHIQEALCEQQEYASAEPIFMTIPENTSLKRIEQIDAKHIQETHCEQMEYASAKPRFITIPESTSFKQMESAIIHNLLTRYSADEVCARFGISRVTLWRKLKNIAP